MLTVSRAGPESTVGYLFFVPSGEKNAAPRSGTTARFTAIGREPAPKDWRTPRDAAVQEPIRCAKSARAVKPKQNHTKNGPFYLYM